MLIKGNKEFSDRNTSNKKDVKIKKQQNTKNFYQKEKLSMDRLKAPMTVKNSPVKTKVKTRKSSLLNQKSTYEKISQNSSIYLQSDKKYTKFEAIYKAMANKLSAGNYASNNSIC